MSVSGKRKALKGLHKSHEVASGSYKGSSGFHCISFDAERRISNKMWNTKCTFIHLYDLDNSNTVDPFIVADGGIKQRRILTNAAKSIIKAEIAADLFSSREGALEPPFMAPSVKSDHYSLVSATQLNLCVRLADTVKWCSFCNDFGDTLVLCAGCRVAGCVAQAGTPSGCLRWSPCIEEVDFIFYCPFCAGRDSRGPCKVSVNHFPTGLQFILLLASSAKSH
jgi:hypothetical protein